MSTIKSIIVNGTAQKAIIAFAKGVLSKQQGLTELKSKMEAIDMAYARYKGDKSEGSDGTDGSTSCGDVFNKDEITAPIVVAQVDAMVAYLADIFIGGYPMFPVLSTPSKRKNAEKLEALLDDHAQLAGYARQILLMLRDGVKYNISALEAEWAPIDQFSVLADFSTDAGTKIQKDAKYLTKLKRLDPYNVIYDTSTNPGDMSTEGDFAGYIEVISKTKLKRLIARLGDKAMNASDALDSYGKLKSSAGSATGGNNVTMHPTISKYVSPNSQHAGVNWDVWLGVGSDTKKDKSLNMYDGSYYEKLVIYARILPADFSIIAPAPKTAQIWKFTIINMTVVIEAERIISAYDTLPILFGQPLEDGMSMQTQSVAEGAMPFQEAASTLYNIRFAAARRSVSDRALYNPDFISPSDINSKAPAPKIPVRLKALSNLGLESAYKQIPFDMRGTESTISDARAIVGFSQELSGINGPQQGQFQKGNKSVQEWNDTIGGSDNRLRLPAMLYEHQVFGPLKQILALNIFQYGDDVTITSQKTGDVLDINIAELRNEVLSFRIADGYSPKSKMAATEVLTSGMNMLMNSPILQQAYGSMLPAMFAHMMQLGGVRDLDQYAPEVAQGASPNLQAAQLQTGQPTAVEGAPAMPNQPIPQ